MSEDTRYNGWRDRATWCVNLWIDNDQGLQEMFAERAQDILRASSEIDDETGKLTDDSRQECVDDLASELESWFDDQVNEVLPDACMLLDLLDTDIDYKEIAEAMIDNAIDEAQS